MVIRNIYTELKLGPLLRKKKKKKYFITSRTAKKTVNLMIQQRTVQIKY